MPGGQIVSSMISLETTPQLAMAVDLKPFDLFQ
jgi:hypothetical protein